MNYLGQFLENKMAKGSLIYVLPEQFRSRYYCLLEVSGLQLRFARIKILYEASDNNGEQNGMQHTVLVPCYLTLSVKYILKP